MGSVSALCPANVHEGRRDKKAARDSYFPAPPPLQTIGIDNAACCPESQSGRFRSARLLHDAYGLRFRKSRCRGIGRQEDFPADMRHRCLDNGLLRVWGGVRNRCAPCPTGERSPVPESVPKEDRPSRCHPRSVSTVPETRLQSFPRPCRTVQRGIIGSRKRTIINSIGRPTIYLPDWFLIVAKAIANALSGVGESPRT